MGCGASTNEVGHTNALHTSNNGTSNANGKTANVSVDDSTLRNFLTLEREIAEAEISNPLKPLDLKTEQLAKTIEDIRVLEENLKNIQGKISSFGKEVSNAVETHSYFIENGISDQLSPDQEKYLDLLNRKEITQKELATARSQEKVLSKEIKKLEVKCEHLQNLYKQQDALLDRIFDGQYGSLLENQLEKELDQLEVQRTRILEANFKWRQAQMMLEYACKQLAVAVQKWQDLPTVPNIDLEIRYSVAAETRNNLVAAGQNVSGAQRYLDKVEFPYMTPPEVNTLNKAAQYVFTDMQSDDRHSHAQECYTTSHKRANALLQWFDTVINSTIMTDLYEMNERVKKKSLDLRKERVRLIKEKAQELYGKELDLHETLTGRHVSLDELAKAGLTDNQVVKVDGGEMEGDRATTPPLLTKDELAPVPSNSIIFGKQYENLTHQIKNLQAQHQDEMKQFMKEQELNESRMRQNLEEKLLQKRQRRARIKIEQKQQSELS